MQLVCASLPSAGSGSRRTRRAAPTAASASSPPTATAVASASAIARLGPVMVAETARLSRPPVMGSSRCGPRS